MKKFRTLLALTAVTLLATSCGALPDFVKLPEIDLSLPSLGGAAAETMALDDYYFAADEFGYETTVNPYWEVTEVVETTADPYWEVTEAVETTAEPYWETTAAATEAPVKALHPEYLSILDTIKLGIKNEWWGEEFEKHNISYLASYAETPSDIYYALYDLDSNGIDELIISDGYGWLLNVFTVNYGYADCLLWGYERLNYDLCEGGYIIESGSDSAMSGSYAVLYLNDGYINTLQSFYYDEEYDPDTETFINKYYFGTDTYDIEEMSEITEESMYEMLNKYTPLNINYTPLG